MKNLAGVFGAAVVALAVVLPQMGFAEEITDTSSLTLVDETAPSGTSPTKSISGSGCMNSGFNWNYLFDNVASGDSSR